MRFVASIIFTAKRISIFSRNNSRKTKHPDREKYGHEHANNVAYPPVPNPSRVARGQLGTGAYIDVDRQEYTAQEETTGRP